MLLMPLKILTFTRAGFVLTTGVRTHLDFCRERRETDPGATTVAGPRVIVWGLGMVFWRLGAGGLAEPQDARRPGVRDVDRAGADDTRHAALSTPCDPLPVSAVRSCRSGRRPWEGVALPGRRAGRLRTFLASFVDLGRL
jgi:hypothetical protein